MSRVFPAADLRFLWRVGAPCDRFRPEQSLKDDDETNGLGVIFLGLALALSGAYGMWTGWDYIQLERGWSLFIGGATAVSGGVVTMALGRVIGVLGARTRRQRFPRRRRRRGRVAFAGRADAPRAPNHSSGLSPPRRPSAAKVEAPTEVIATGRRSDLCDVFRRIGRSARPTARRRYPSLAALRRRRAEGAIGRRERADSRPRRS